MRIKIDGWEQRKLGATNTFFTDGNYGEAYPKSSDMTDSGSGVPFLTGGNLKDGKLSLKKRNGRDRRRYRRRDR